MSNCAARPHPLQTVSKLKLMPRACPVETHARRYKESCATLPDDLFFVAASVKLHGARPWHPQTLLTFLSSRERESPRHKAVASANAADLSL